VVEAGGVGMGVVEALGGAAAGGGGAAATVEEVAAGGGGAAVLDVAFMNMLPSSGSVPLDPAV